jgi:hypothetical protein
MTDTDLQRQLEELRQQVATLAAARQAGAEATEPQAEVGSGSGDEAEPTDRAEPLEQINELVHLLEEELKDNPILSGLAIFIAGLLVGRMMR